MDARGRRTRRSRSPPASRFAAWTYNGRIPGPTLRAREGERLRITFVNGSDHPHTIHFHGIHPAPMDGVPGVGAGKIAAGERTVYEFDAEPFGLHLYHCHVRPLAEHIAKGMYGAFVIDPKEGREEADELVMVMNGFDTNFDRANELYAVNTIGFAYMDQPVAVKRGELVRIYLVNVLEYDLINSFHVHGNFFHYFPTGHVAQPGGVHGHRDALPGPARDRRAALPDRRARSCSTPTSPSSRSSAGRASSRSVMEAHARPPSI